MAMPITSPLETVLRGTVMYVMLLVPRLVPRRTVGSIGIMDPLVVVLIAEAAGKAMGDDDSTLGDGLILVATLIGWSYVLNWLAHAVPAIDRLAEARPLPVVRNGRPLRRNMRAELLTEGELMRRLRLEGIEDLGEVKAAYVEGDSTLSVTEYKEGYGP